MKVFLSAVSGQFRSCREELRRDLAKIECQVRVQEDFRTGPHTLIEKLEQYVMECDRVIVLVGDAYGCEAEGQRVPLLHPPRSYTQWEYYFARGERLDGSKAEAKPTYTYFASRKFLQDHPVEQSPEFARRQCGFVSSIKDSGKDRAPFDGVDQLCRMVLCDGWQINERPGDDGGRLPFSHQRPSHLARYIARPSLVDRVMARLKLPPNGSRTPLCVLLAPSGYGKSLVALDVVQAWPGHWAWLSADQPADIESPESIPCDALIVLDGLDVARGCNGRSDESAFEGILRGVVRSFPWLKDRLPAALLVTTSQEGIVREVLRVRGRAQDRDEVVVPVEGFSYDEAREFADSAADRSFPIAEGVCRALNAALNGNPFIWNMVVDSPSLQALPELYELGGDPGRHPDLCRRVFDAWLEVCAPAALTRKAAQFLSCVSRIGASPDAVAFALRRPECEYTPDDVLTALEPLARRGFLRETAPGDTALVPHTLLRAACGFQNCAFDRDGAIWRYRRWLLDAIDTKAGDCGSPTSVIDAWIVGVRETYFDAAHRRDTTELQKDRRFLVRYSEGLESLDRVLLRAGKNRLELAWVARFFREQLCGFDCRERAALVSLIEGITPRNELFAETCWEAASWIDDDNQDWTSVCRAIHAAAVHWSGIDGDRTDRAEMYVRRIRQTLERHNRDDRMDMSMEICGLIGGLNILGQGLRSLQLIADLGLCEKAPDAVLVAILALVERDRVELAREAIRQFWEAVPVDEHKVITGAYLANRGLLPEVPARRSCELNPWRLGFAAEMAGASKFIEFFGDLCRNKGQWFASKVSGHEIQAIRITFS